MNKIIGILEEKLIPIAAWLEGNKYVNGVRRAFVMLMPLLMIGSLFLMLQSFPLPAYQNFMKSTFGDNWGAVFDIPVNATFSMLAVYVSFLVAQQLAKQFELDSVAVGILSTVAFFILTPLGKSTEYGNVITFDWLGSRGMFIAIMVGVFTMLIFRFFVQRNILVKMPEGVPPEVIKSFEALIPGAVILTIALILRVAMAHTEFGTIHDFVYKIIAIPLKSLGTSYIGSMFTVLSISVLWSVGINAGSMVNGIVRPFWLENQLENIAAMQAGQELPHVITEQFFDMVWMGGSGATLSLLLAIIIFAKSKHIKSVGEIAGVPGLFNINEPLLFGLPVILNPIMLIPFNIVPLVVVTTQYIAMNIGLVAKPLGIAMPWTTPAVINGFFVVGGISGALMQAFNLVLGALIYLPFLRILDKASLKEEEEAGE